MLLKSASNNTKLRTNAERIYTWSLPEYRDQLTGDITCPQASHCIKGCFFAHGPTSWKQNQAIYSSNYALSQSDLFPRVMVNEINAMSHKKRPEFIRVHVGGDFYNAEYLCKWIEIANALQDIKFYGYTKSITALHDAWIDIPHNNMEFAQSIGGKEDDYVWHRELTARVYADESLIPDDHVNATHNDLLGFFNETRKIGLGYKGNLDQADRRFVHGVELILNKKGRLSA